MRERIFFGPLRFFSITESAASTWLSQLDMSIMENASETLSWSYSHRNTPNAITNFQPSTTPTREDIHC